MTTKEAGKAQRTVKQSFIQDREKNGNQYYRKVPVVICLSALFPAEIMKACVSVQEDRLPAAREFLQYLLPREYRMLRIRETDSEIDLSACDDRILDCFWNGNTDNHPPVDHLFLSMKERLLLDSSCSGSGDSPSHGLIGQLLPKLQDMIEKLPADLLTRYKKKIHELCVVLKNDRSRFSGLSSVDFCKAFPVLKRSDDQDEQTFPVTLAHLVLLACTSSVWCKPEKNSRTSAEEAGRMLLPCLSTNILPITYHDGFAELPRICWGTLFPDSFLIAYQRNAEGRVPRSTVEWFQTFFPDGYQAQKNRLYVTDRSNTSFSNYWGGKPEGNSCCKCVGNNIIKEGKKLSGRYEALLLHIAGKCRDILSVFKEDYLILYEQDLDTLYQRLFSSCETVLGKAESRLVHTADGKTDSRSEAGPDSEILQDEEVLRRRQLLRLSGKLALLILIASTWTVWASSANRALAKALFEVIFRRKNTEDAGDFCEDDLFKQQNQTASDQLEEARKAFCNRDFAFCARLCRKILSLYLAKDEILGDAYYYLVLCHDNYGCKDSGYYNKKEFQYRAVELGSKAAREIWSSRRLNSLLYVPEPGKETDSEVVFNTSADCERAGWFLQSRPESDTQAAAQYVQSTEDLSAYIQPGRCIRFLLIHDSFEKNYLDLLYILDAVKNWNRKNAPENAVFSDSVWKDFRIYVRLNENAYASLLDTALKHMDGFHVPVFLIDDAKRAAQGLLSQFPLFYPIRTLSAGDLSKRKITLNLNIISERSDDLTNWLIREAYWLGCFCYTGITLAVNIISPEIRKIMNRLEYDCPGIFLPVPDEEKVSKIKWNFGAGFPDSLKSAQNSGAVSLDSLESGELFEILGEFRKASNCYSYYVVNCESDLASLNLAIKIREWEIRQLVRSSAAIGTSNLPVITYHFENRDLAHMAESMVVHQEAYGDNWYNNYSLLSFGASRYYHWDDIDGGYTEKVSQCVHLQYCGCDVHASESERKEALESYFTRCYNRDSSMAVALSMPYRLFQMASPEADHILPFGWVIKNKAAFSDPLSLEGMAARAEAYTNKEEMLDYERARWMRYMISRGWQRATAEETIKFMRAGNPGRQLYIGLLHGCIGSREELSELQAQLYGEYRYGLAEKEDQRFAGNEPRLEKSGNSEREVFDKYLQYDISSLNQTADIIRTSWFSGRDGRMDEQEKTER